MKKTLTIVASVAVLVSAVGLSPVNAVVSPSGLTTITQDGPSSLVVTLNDIDCRESMTVELQWPNGTVTDTRQGECTAAFQWIHTYEGLTLPTCEGTRTLDFEIRDGAANLYDQGQVAVECAAAPPVPPPPPADSDGDGVPDASDNCPAVAGPASNSGCPVPVVDERPIPKVKAKAVAKRGKIKVNVNPNLPKAKYWKFKVQKLKADGETWKKWRSYKTKTKKEIRKVNPKKGKYRIFVPEQRGHQSAYSKVVKLKR